MHEITFKNKRIFYDDLGHGPVVLLLHGYLETKAVWNSFAEKLSGHFRLIIPDIPGHGFSEVFGETHSMGLMAEALNFLLDSLNIEKCHVIGHSMGGYVMLAFADIFPEKINRLVLFHSSIYADSDEKKQNRQREIELIQSGKLELIINSNLPRTFANENLSKFSVRLSSMKEEARQHNPDGVCALLRGMMDRPDRQEMIKNLDRPMLYIFGKKDNYIGITAAEKMMAVNPVLEVNWLENSGHMGFVEEENKSIEIIRQFLF